MSKTSSSIQIRVYYEDTDAGGVVYHASYLRFFERGRTEWLRQMNFAQSQIREKYGVLFAVHHMEIKFVRPAKFDDLLRVETTLEKFAKASFGFQQHIFCISPQVKDVQSNKQEDTLICSAHVKIACLDVLAFRPKALPTNIKEEILRARTERE